MFPEWTWIVGLFVGAAIGSFLNVVIYRMPRGISLGKPKHSFCPNCKHQLGIPDLVPLFSWLFLRGRCRYCLKKVPARYFFVELMTGSIWAGIWYQYLIANQSPPDFSFAPAAKAIAYCLSASALVAIIFIDWEFYIIPDQVNAFLAFVGIGYNIFLYVYPNQGPGHDPATTWGIPSSLAGWIVGVAVLWGIAFLGRVLFRKDAMGHGDIKMARGIGTVLFPAVACISFGLAVFLGAVLGIVQIVLFPPKDNSASQIADNAESDNSEEVVTPESIPSLLKCGLGYLLGIDILGLFVPRLYEWWFGEHPFEHLEIEDEFEVERTMIPFGPYLALGAILATVFSTQLTGAVNKYLESTGISRTTGNTLELR